MKITTENYIIKYIEAIERGDVTVGIWVSMWYRMVEADLRDHKYFYDARKAAKAIAFIETFCRHSKGSLAPGKIKLELWQKAFLSVVFGCVDGDGKRHFREVVLIIGRKNGKSLLASAVAAYLVYADNEYGADIYFAATKLDQANICFNSFLQMVRTEPALAELAKKRQGSLVEIPSTNSTVMALAHAAKSSDGLNAHGIICDEIAAWGANSLQFYSTLSSGFGSRTQPLLLDISTAGTISEGVYDEVFARCTRLLKGDSTESRLAPFLYTFDDERKWKEQSELKKSNPNMGVSVQWAYFEEEIAKAENSLPAKAEFIAKYGNIKQNPSIAWLKSSDVAKCCGAPLNIEDFRGCYCVGGVDLSRTTDLTCACIVIEICGEFYIFAKFFLPKNKIDELAARDNMPYRQYIERGLLVESGENTIDYDDAVSWYREIIKTYKLYPLITGYDRYNANTFIKDLNKQQMQTDDVFQGENLTPIIHIVEGLIQDGKIHIGDNDLLKAHFLNSALKTNIETERCRLVKLGKYFHVDGMAATLDAFTVRDKWAAKYGKLLRNEKKKGAIEI